MIILFLSLLLRDITYKNYFIDINIRIVDNDVMGRGLEWIFPEIPGC